jgi:hypothetical protein
VEDEMDINTKDMTIERAQGFGYDKIKIYS